MYRRPKGDIPADAGSILFTCLLRKLDGITEYGCITFY